MNAPSSGSCAHQVAARYQPLNRFQFLCYSPEVPIQNRTYRALWSTVRHSTCVLFVPLRIIEQCLPRSRKGTRSVTGSLTDPGGHGQGSLLSGNLFMHTPYIAAHTGSSNPELSGIRHLHSNFAMMMNQGSPRASCSRCNMVTVQLLGILTHTFSVC
jgi:hypothetical protein